MKTGKFQGLYNFAIVLLFYILMMGNFQGLYGQADKALSWLRREEEEFATEVGSNNIFKHLIFSVRIIREMSIIMIFLMIKMIL